MDVSSFPFIRNHLAYSHAIFHANKFAISPRGRPTKIVSGISIWRISYLNLETPRALSGITLRLDFALFLSLSLSLYRTPGSSLCPKERMYVSTRESLSRFCGIKSSLRKTLGGFSSNKRSKSNERIKLSLATGDTGVCLHASPCSRCVRFKCITVKFARQRIPRVVLAGYSFFLSVTLLRRRRGVLLFEERTCNLD